MREGRCGEGITVLKTNDFSCRGKEAMSFSSLAACSRGLVQHFGMTLLLGGFFFFVLVRKGQKYCV